jgi:hypothetical protein
MPNLNTPVADEMVGLRDNARMMQLTGSVMRKLVTGAQKMGKDTRTLFNKASTIGHVATCERKIWEISAGRGRVTEELRNDPDIKAERFGYEDGWDFDRANDRKRFLNRLKTEKPDEVLISPPGSPCRLWSSLQELSLAQYPEGRPILDEARRKNPDTILAFVAVIYLEQWRNNRRATIEHPWASRAWATKAFAELPGWSAYVDQCMYNLTTHDERGQVQPVKKPTCFYTTKESLAKKISAFCGKKGQECHLFHQPLEGFDPIDKVSRSKAAENYPPCLAQDLAQAMAEKDDGIYAQEEEVDTEDNDDPQYSRGVIGSWRPPEGGRKF